MEFEKNEAFYKSLLDNLHDAIYFTDTQRRITYWNHGAERISGFTEEQVIGHKCSENILMHVDDQGRQLCKGMCPLAQSMQDGETREANIFLHHKDGHRVPVWVRVSPIRDEAGNIIGGVELFNDRSSVIAELEKIDQMQKELFIDPLTRIGNRRYTQDKLSNSMSEYNRNKVRFGVLFSDIDHFKHINDRYGHHTGDRVLEMIASTLALNLRAYDFVGRWGGEEFIIIISNIDIKRFTHMAERLRKLVEKSSYTHNDETISVTVSMGGALVREGDDIESLVNRADEQLYSSKNNGRNRVTILE